MARPTQITDDTIAKALAAGGEVTALELAARLRMGQSTAAKRLAALETSGAVRRTPGGRVRGVRVADRWSIVAPVPDAAVPDAEVATAEVAEIAIPTTDGPDPAAPEVAPPETATVEAVAVERVAEGGGSGRLGRGALGTLVRDYLAARPGEAFGPSTVGKALGRSAGAVSNSLATMAARGEVELVGDKPRRYRITSSTPV